jgi:hypothetical protein
MSEALVLENPPAAKQASTAWEVGDVWTFEYKTKEVTLKRRGMPLQVSVEEFGVKPAYDNCGSFQHDMYEAIKTQPGLDIIWPHSDDGLMRTLVITITQPK